jgi:outer membrane protein TolC
MRKDGKARASCPGRGWGRVVFPRWTGNLLVWSGAVIVMGACSPQMYRNRADREVYGALIERTPEVANVSPSDIELVTPDPPDLSNLASNSQTDSFLGEFASYEQGAKVLTLDEALATGIRHSRDYLTTKESLYLQALDLTLARFRLQPIFYAGGAGTRAVDSRTAKLEEGMTEIVSTNTFARTQSAGFNWLCQTGARLSADFTQDFLRIMTGNESVNRSDLAVTLVQPLLQGGGTTVTMEALTQEERDLLYALRDFADYRRDFIVDLVSEYYGVLLAREIVKNNYLAYQGFLKNVEREEAFAEEDRRTQNQLGRLRQAKLQAESRWIAAIRTYLNRLDEFKISLGVPVDSRLVLDAKELAKLRIDDPDVSREESVEVALVTRPDLANAADRVVDSERKVKVARNGLLPRLDVALDYNSVSDPGDTTPAINWDRRRWAGSVDLDLPLNRKAERNIYRATFIQVDRAKRAEDLARDRARLEIYDGWRALDQKRISFDIAEQGVALAARRLEEQLLLSELGRGVALDLVDAQEDLVDAQNQRTSALIDHTVARLRLWRDMGILYIESDGRWAETLGDERP